MKLTRFEGLLLRNQHEILSYVDPDNADYHKKMIEVYEHGWEIEYDWRTEHVYSDEDILSEQECVLVIDSTSVFEALQRSVRAHKDKTELTEEQVGFSGFDGNQETAHLAYARFLMEKDGRFTSLRLGTDGLNSHWPMIPTYRRMTQIWNAIQKLYQLTPHQMEILWAARRA